MPGDEKKVLVALFAAPLQTDLVQRLQTKYPDYEIRVGSGEDPDTLKDAEVLFTLGNAPSPSLVPKLKLVQVVSAGVDHYIGKPLYADTKIPFCTSNGVHGPQITEWVVMALLSFGHRLPRLLEWQREHRWGKFTMRDVVDLHRQRLGILGYGSIGRQVARVCKAMGMDVIVLTASPRPTPESRRDDGYIVPGTGDPDGSIPSEWYSGTSREDLHKFLSQNIDVLLASLPLTPSTRHMLGKEEFKLLPNAFVMNVSRGGIVDQDALIDACKGGVLRGAALDATDPEPLPSDSKLWDVENIFVSPHISGYTTKYMDRAVSILELNLDRLNSGEKLINEVDRKKGY